MSTLPDTTLRLQSLVSAEGTLELSLVEAAVRPPGPDEVVVRIEAAPINPSDLGLLLAGVDTAEARSGGTPDRPTVSADVADGVLKALAARVGRPQQVGNEGGGVVVAAGSSPAAQALLGRTVGAFGGAMYTQYRTIEAANCLAVPDGVTPVQAASCFVNPLTALGMVGTMRRDGHTALVHTAAASNLGQMLVKVCQADGVPLVNIVRKPEQEELLRGLGATHVCSTGSETFRADLVAALTETGATIAFDAIGGGPLVSQILTAMEAAANARDAAAETYNRYGSDTFKQVFIYGGLDQSPTELRRNFGFSWSVGGWLLMPYLQRAGAAEAEAMRQRVAAEITTTFASTYTATVSLAGALSLESIAAYRQQATGTKFLIAPHA